MGVLAVWTLQWRVSNLELHPALDACGGLHRRCVMTLPTVFLLAVIAAGLARASWRKSALAVSAVALILIVGIGCGPVAGALVQGLQAGYPAEPQTDWGGSSVIILLGGGTERVARGGPVETNVLAYGRLVKALELYLACKRQRGQCTILASGGDPRRNGISEAAVYGSQLRKLGVDPADILLEQRSLNTWQNAQFSARLLSQRPAERVFLVSSGIHLRRSLLYFAHFGVHATAVRADHVTAMLSPLPLAYNFLLADLALHEYAGILRYHVYELLGWNAAAKGAGAL